MGEKVYVLHGYWNTEDTDGCAVISMSRNIDTVRQKLENIAECKGAEYISVPYEMIEMEHTDRMLELSDDVLARAYAKFYITEELID